MNYQRTIQPYYPITFYLNVRKLEISIVMVFYIKSNLSTFDISTLFLVEYTLRSDTIQNYGFSTFCYHLILYSIQ